MKNKPKILVVGSFVMDLIVSSEKFPSSGETVMGCGFSTAAGGKGANQAIQASRLGADVVMVGMVGNDDFGKCLLSSAEDSGVDISLVKITDKAPSAIGNVQLEISENGTENRIIVYYGANMLLEKCDVEVLKDSINEFDMVMLQNEIPMEINTLVAAYAKEASVPVMLNPAPTMKLPKELISSLTYISPNEHEAEDITGIAPDSEESFKKMFSAITEMGVGNVLITLGKEGSAYFDGERIIKSASVDSGRAKDPTAAGDSFVASFCTAVAAGIDIESALTFANCTAGITVTKMGAQTSLPTLDEVLTVMKENNLDIAPFEALKGN